MSTEVDELMQRNYPVLLKEVPALGYFVSIPGLPGCVGQGNTLEEAMEDIKEAKEDWFEAALESGVAIPLPESEKEYSGQFLLRMPKSLHKAIAEEAAIENVSMNQYLNVVIVENRHIRALKKDRLLSGLNIENTQLLAYLLETSLKTKTYKVTEKFLKWGPSGSTLGDIAVESKAIGAKPLSQPLELVDSVGA